MLLRPCVFPVSRRGGVTGKRYTATNTGTQTIAEPSDTLVGSLALVVLTEEAPSFVPGLGMQLATASAEFAATDDLGFTVDISEGLDREVVFPVGVTPGFESQLLSAASPTIDAAVRKYAVPMAPLSAAAAHLATTEALAAMKAGSEDVVGDTAKVYAKAVSTCHRRARPGDAFLVLSQATVFQDGSLSGVVLQTADPRDAVAPPTGPHPIGWLAHNLRARAAAAAAPLLVEAALHLNRKTHEKPLDPPRPLPGYHDILGFTSAVSAAQREVIPEDVLASLATALDPAALLTTGAVCLTGPGAHPAIVELFRDIAATTAALPGVLAASRDMDTGGTNVSPLMTSPVAATVQRKAGVLTHILDHAFAACTAWARSAACPPALKAPCMPAHEWATYKAPTRWILDPRRPLFRAAVVHTSQRIADVERWAVMAGGAPCKDPVSPLSITELDMPLFVPWRHAVPMAAPPPARDAPRIPAVVPTLWRPSTDRSGFSDFRAVCAMLDRIVPPSPQRPRLAKPAPLSPAKALPAVKPPPPPPRATAKKKAAHRVPRSLSGLAIEDTRPRRRRPKASEEDADVVVAEADAEQDKRDAEIHAARSRVRTKAVRRVVAREMMETAGAGATADGDEDDEDDEETVGSPAFLLMRYTRGNVETNFHTQRTVSAKMFASQPVSSLPGMQTTTSGPKDEVMGRRTRRGAPFLAYSRKRAGALMAPVGSLPSPALATKVVAGLKKDTPEARMAIAADIALCMRVLFTTRVLPDSLATAWLDALAMTTPAAVSVVRRDVGGPFSSGRPLVTAATVDEWLCMPAKLVSTLPHALRTVLEYLNDDDKKTWERNAWLSQASAGIEWVMASVMRPVGCNSTLAPEGRCLGRRRMGRARVGPPPPEEDDDDGTVKDDKEGTKGAYLQRAVESISCEAVTAPPAPTTTRDAMRLFFTACGRKECVQAIARAVVGALAVAPWDVLGANTVLDTLLSEAGVARARALFHGGDRVQTITFGSGATAVSFELIVLTDPWTQRNTTEALCGLFDLSRSAAATAALPTVEHGNAAFVASRLAFAGLCVSAASHPRGKTSPLRVSSCSVMTDGPGTQDMQRPFREVRMIGEPNEKLHKHFKTADMAAIEAFLNTSRLDTYVTMMPTPAAVAMVLQVMTASYRAPKSNREPWTKGVDTMTVAPTHVWRSGRATRTTGVLPPGTCRVWGPDMYLPVSEAKRVLDAVVEADTEWMSLTLMAFANCGLDMMGVLDGRVGVKPGGGMPKTRRSHTRGGSKRPRVADDDDGAALVDNESSSESEIELGVPGPPPEAAKPKKKTPEPKKRRRPPPKRKATDIMETMAPFVEVGAQVVLVDGLVTVRTLTGPLIESAPVQRHQSTTMKEHAKASAGKPGIGPWVALAADLTFTNYMKRLPAVRAHFDMWQGDVDNVCRFGWYDEVVYLPEEKRWIHARCFGRKNGPIIKSRVVTAADVGHMRATEKTWAAEVCRGEALAAGRHPRIPPLLTIGLPPATATRRLGRLREALAAIDEAGSSAWKTDPEPPTFTRFATRLREWGARGTKEWNVHWRNALDRWKK